MWHEVKEYLHRKVKPRTKSDLVNGIGAFWRTVDESKCCKYINHLKKVILCAIELKGDATGYWCF